MSFPIKLNTSACLQCGLCESACLYQALHMNAYPEIDESACQLCKNCIEACPAEALSLVIQPRVISQSGGTSLENNASSATGIWVLAECTQKEIAPVVFELLGEARRLTAAQPQPVSAVLLGQYDAALTDQLFAAGADRVYQVDRFELNQPIEDHHAEALAELARRFQPAILLIGATHFGRGVSARVAALLNTGLTADCTELSIDPVSGNLLQRRPAFGGNLLATIETPNHRPQMASVRPQVMKALSQDISRTGEQIVCDLSDLTFNPNIKLIAGQIRETIDSITNSSILVAGGRGMQRAENIHLLYELADILGGTVAASRAAVEAGWLPVERQVGQTGKTVAPRVYIACGISGQIQHTAAISGAETIIAINNDSDAPIFNYADYGLVGDVAEILPQLIRELADK